MQDARVKRVSGTVSKLHTKTGLFNASGELESECISVGKPDRRNPDGNMVVKIIRVTDLPKKEWAFISRVRLEPKELFSEST
jgi:hypothetical protein